MIRCQHCQRQATIHITEIVKGSPHEFHLCEEHARQQLSAEEETAKSKISKATAKSGGKRSRESARDQQTCPQCGISFHDFRSSGRLGCPNDYAVFAEELNSLLESIHGELHHHGKVPGRSPSTRRDYDELMHLRLSLKQAIAREDYETAARIRDQIRTRETHPPASSQDTRTAKD